MAAKKAEKSNGERVWWTARECWTYLGITHQKWARLVIEQSVPKKSDETGIERFDPDAVEDIAERFGYNNSDDPRVEALKVLRATLESISNYASRLADENLDIVKELRSENASLREMNAKNQEQHLKALVATQEALDLSAERQYTRIAVEAQQARINVATAFLIENVGPEILKQWKAGNHSEKIIHVVRSLAPEQLAALKAVVTPEQSQMLEDILNDRSEPRSGHTSAPPSHDHPSGGGGTRSGDGDHARNE